MELRPSFSLTLKNATPDGQRNWLEHCFGRLRGTRAFGGGVTLRLPSVYRFVMHPDDATTFNRAAHFEALSAGKLPSLRFQPHRMEVTTPTEKEALSQIFTTVQNNDNDLKLFQPRPGQKEGRLIDPEKYYAVIYEKDPRHNHGIPNNLLDFIHLHADEQGIFKGMIADGSDTHSHLMPL